MPENRSTSTREVEPLAEADRICAQHIRSHRLSARFILTFLSAASILLGALVLVVVTYGRSYSPFRYIESEKDSAAVIAAIQAANTQNSTTTFILLGLFGVVFGVLMAVYRFHLHEIARSEHYRLGFLRIRIASAHKEKGFQTEVRQALTAGAFDYGTDRRPLRRAPIESPLPGHPASDAATAVLNRLLEEVEFRASPKKETSKDE
jgi:hypothetical protein